MFTRLYKARLQDLQYTEMLRFALLYFRVLGCLTFILFHYRGTELFLEIFLSFLRCSLFFVGLDWIGTTSDAGDLQESHLDSPS